MTTSDAWNVAQYDKFKTERSRPFFDLISLIKPREEMTALDLGCGSGHLTAAFHKQFGCRETIGVDMSAKMLADAPSSPGLTFELADASRYSPGRRFDVVLSNAMLQWIPDHPRFFLRVADMLTGGGQMVFQFPNNGSHVYQQTAYELEGEYPHIPKHQIDASVLKPEEYALVLDELGFEDVEVLLRVYVHHLERGDQVLEWAKGTFLTHYASAMEAEEFEGFMAQYRERLFRVIPADQPYTFTFRRMFLSAFTSGTR